MKQLSKIGYILKAHKLVGEVKCVLKEYTFNNNNIPPFLFIENKGHTLPFFIEKLDAVNSNELIIKFEDIEDKETAYNLKGATIFIDENETTHKCFEKMKRVEDKLNLSGFQLFDEEDNFIAKIEDVYFIPNNTLAAVIIDKEEVLFPLNEELIVKIDRNKKMVYLKIPDGLLGLNNNSSEEE